MANNRTGQMVVVKLSHRADLGRDPSMGTVLAHLPDTHKIKIEWSDGVTRTHDTRSPYMDRFTYYKV